MVSVLNTEIEDFPCGEIKKQESPDFIIISPNKTVGIEVTMAINPNSAGPTPLTEIRGAQFKCLEMVRQNLAQKRDAPVEVGVQFRDDHTPINIKEATRELYNFILEKVDNIDDTKSWHWTESGLKYISWVFIRLGTISGKKWLNKHRVHRIYNCEVNINPYDIIQKAIDSKNAKLAEYQKQCNECWLIIGVDELTAPGAVKILDNDDSTYLSDFARTYFISGFEGLVWPLNTVPSNTRSP
jgi:hypothetical protein